MKKSTRSRCQEALKILLFMGGLAGILVLLSRFLKPKREQVYDVVSLEKMMALYDAETDNTSDVVFIGDSEAYATFCPMVMFEKAGFTSYVGGVSAQRLCDTYAFLENVFRSQSPKAVVLETNNLYRYAGAEVEADDAYQRMSQRVFPVLKYHSRWKTFCIATMNRKNDFAAQAQHKGFRFRDTTKPYTKGDYMIPTDSEEAFAKGAEEYLDRIISLCREKGVELMLVSAPSPVCWNYEKHNAVASYADRNGLTYCDLNLMTDQLGIDWRKDTKDAGNHLNYVGAVKVSEYLAGYLAGEFQLADHRSDPDYAEWTQVCETFFAMTGR